MAICDSTFTVGQCTNSHFGKFDSCRDEALYALSMDADSTTGTTELYAHYARVTLTSDELVSIGDSATVSVPAGDYVVQTSSSGGVTVYPFDAADWDLEELRTEGFDSAEFCESCSWELQCADHALMLSDPGEYRRQHPLESA